MYALTNARVYILYLLLLPQSHPSYHTIALSKLSPAHIYIATTSSSPHGPLRRSSPLQTVIHPLLHCIIAPRIKLVLHHLLHHLASKAHEIVPPQRILKQPILPLALLPLQQLLVAKLPRADPQVAAHGQQVEANLGGVVAGDSALQHVNHL